jgi:hypothetical protein
VAAGRRCRAGQGQRENGPPRRPRFSEPRDHAREHSNPPAGPALAPRAGEPLTKTGLPSK